MGDLTRAELREEVVQNLGNNREYSIDDISSAKYISLNRAFDRCQKRIAAANSAGWEVLRRRDSVTIPVTGTAATDMIYTPAIDNFHKWKSLIRQQYSTERAVKLMRMLRSQWDRLVGVPSGTSSGRVTHYMEDRSAAGVRQLIWFRVPNEPFTLWRYYTVHPTPFADDDATSTFEDLDDVMISYCSAYCFRQLEMFDEEAHWYKNYLSLIQQAISDDQMQTDIDAIPQGDSANQIGYGVNTWQDPFSRRTR